MAGRRFFVGVGNANPGTPFATLEMVDSDLVRMRNVFVDSCGFSAPPDLRELDALVLRSKLSDWLEQTALTKDDTLVLYYTGHGYIERARGYLDHYLVTRGFREDAVADGLKTQQLIELVVTRSKRPGKLWVILDCCHSGNLFNDQTLSRLASHCGDSFLLASTNKEVNDSYDGEFTRAFVACVESAPPRTLSELSTAMKGLDAESKQTPQTFISGDAPFDFFDQLDPTRLPVLPPRRRPPRHLYTAAVVLGVVGGLAAVVYTAVLHNRAPMVTIPGAAIQLGTSEEAARALFAQCQELRGESCGESFDASPFARQVQRSPHATQVATFLLDKYEVTNREYASFMALHREQLLALEWQFPGAAVRRKQGAVFVAVATDVPSMATFGIELHDDRYRPTAGRADHAVAHVTWDGAEAYCRTLNKRLPTEAEWELAARGATGRSYPWVDTNEDAPVDRTPEGVRDLGAGLSEWTATSWLPDSEAERARCTEPCRVVRGASVGDAPLWSHAAVRSRLIHNELDDNVGFRCAKDVEP